MPVLKDYNAFDGRHWETGSIHNMLAFAKIKAPHSGQPISEALLLGISGGITVGYFTFHYEGHDPHLALLPRNTFDPLETIFERLALPRDVVQTTSAETGQANLIEVLESRRPALVWADMFTLPYNGLGPRPDNWAMIPVVVFGLEDGMAHIADRSRQPLRVPAETLAAARGRVKKDKFRLMTFDVPDLNRLASAAQKGIWQCISLYTELPPKGGKDNFGFAALEKWAAMLTNTRNKQSWERLFPPGSALYNALVGHTPQPGLLDWICTWGTGDGADRGVYADFLDEAAVLLNKPDLRAAGQIFRQSREVWNELAAAALPDSVSDLRLARDLKLQKHRLFVEQGDTCLDEIRAINAQLDELQARVAANFPLDAAGVAALREAMAEVVGRIHTIERDAINALQTAML